MSSAEGGDYLMGFASSMKQVSGVKAEVDLDAAAPRLSFSTALFFDTKPI